LTQRLSRVAHFIGGLTAELNQQKRAPRGQQIHRRDAFFPRDVRQVMIEAFERLRPMSQHPRHLIGGEENIVEADHHEREMLRLRHEAHRRIQNRGECPLRSDNRAREVEAIFRQ
jgi:hypothetical protein